MRTFTLVRKGKEGNPEPIDVKADTFEVIAGALVFSAEGKPRFAYAPGEWFKVGEKTQK